jgi:hypothetical protein
VEKKGRRRATKNGGAYRSLPIARRAMLGEGQIEQFAPLFPATEGLRAIAAGACRAFSTATASEKSGAEIQAVGFDRKQGQDQADATKNKNGLQGFDVKVSSSQSRKSLNQRSHWRTPRKIASET